MQHILLKAQGKAQRAANYQLCLTSSFVMGCVFFCTCLKSLFSRRLQTYCQGVSRYLSHRCWLSMVRGLPMQFGYACLQLFRSWFCIQQTLPLHPATVESLRCMTFKCKSCRACLLHGTLISLCMFASSLFIRGSHRIVCPPFCYDIACYPRWVGTYLQCPVSLTISS